MQRIPGVRKAGSNKPGPLRVLIAEADDQLRKEIGAVLSERYGAITAIDARDAPSAIEALLVKHPDVVLGDVRLAGHPQGGLRVVLDAVSLGVPVVVVSGQLASALRTKLDELGVTYVMKGASASTLGSAIDRALEPRQALTRPSSDRDAARAETA
jgi:DNA-binding NarL/FixJ family response regulator